jgi:hypothetical protein
LSSVDHRDHDFNFRQTKQNHIFVSNHFVDAPSTIISSHASRKTRVMALVMPVL